MIPPTESLTARWLPLGEKAFWEEFKKRFPEHAESMYARAEMHVKRLYGEAT